MEQAGLRGAGAHVHLLDAAVFGTCKEEPGLPGLLRLLTAPSPRGRPEPLTAVDEAEGLSQGGGGGAQRQQQGERGRHHGGGGCGGSSVNGGSGSSAGSHERGGPARRSAGARPARGAGPGAGGRPGPPRPPPPPGRFPWSWVRLDRAPVPPPVRWPRLQPGKGQRIHRRGSSATGEERTGGWGVYCDGTTALGQTDSLEIPTPGLYWRIQC